MRPIRASHIFRPTATPTTAAATSDAEVVACHAVAAPAGLPYKTCKTCPALLASANRGFSW